MTEEKILENALKKAEQIVKKNQFNKTSGLIRKDIDLLIENIEQNKSLVSAVVTSLVKKILKPMQDIRLHRTDFENGYSARVLDTKYTSQFFKSHFPKYANKESSFLTLATRERIKWDINEGAALKIRNKKLKSSFLNIFEQIENHNINPEDYLNYLFAKMLLLTVNDEIILEKAAQGFKNLGTLNINIIIEMLNKHFNEKFGSRLPVIAIYSIYQILLPILKRYENKKLVPFEVHTSSDKHSFGDIEIQNLDNSPFEIIEIKHKIPLDKFLIFDIVKKTENTHIDRYYILTTYKTVFENEESERNINDFIKQIKQSIGIDIIANGIITTIKYYLRFINDYHLFVKIYTQNLIKDARLSTETKSEHIKKWIEILKESGLQ